MESFHYEPLASDTQSLMIRLLTLQPGLEGSNIECALSSVSLHASPVYEALSYHWGDSNCKYSIKCNKASKEITENLFAALCQIRSPTRSKLLWIDAICINQSSDREKTQQVRLMRKIYEAAQRVLIWLGPSSTDSWRDAVAIRITSTLPTFWSYNTQRQSPDALAIEPDYNLDSSTVFHMVALEMLKKGRNLDLLSVPRVLKSSEIGSLPSWVPDWSISDFANSFRLPNLRGAPFLDYTATPLDEGYDLQIKNNILIGLGGEVVDRIIKIGDLHSFQAEDGINWLHRLTRIPSEQAVFSNWEKIASARSATIYNPTGESILDAYWQTLIAGQTLEGLDAGREEYLEWDSTVRSNFRHMPTSPLPRWTRGIVALPMLLAYYGKSLISGRGEVERIMQFRQKMTVATDRRLFRTQKGYLGLGPMGLSQNDAVTLLKGGMVPLVLRERGADKWELVGDCYVHGMMRGEAFVKERCHTLWIT